MSEVVLDVNKQLTREELDEIQQFFEPICLKARLRPELSLALPPVQPLERAVGLQHSFGIDPATILVIGLSSGSAVFLTKLTQEMAVDFWKGVKRLLAMRSKRQKAIPLNSVQVQLSVNTSSISDLFMITTWFNVRFLNEAAVAELARNWYDQLLEKLDYARSLPQNPTNESQVKAVAIHAVIKGSVTAEWHITVGGTDVSSE